MSITVLFGCTKVNNGGSSVESTADIVRTIAGTSAIGRAGRWSNNCLNDACVRADSQGNFLLATPVSNSALMYSDIPEADGTNIRLYSRYRLDDGITTSLVNINPSTQAIMDIWSRSSQGLSIDLCAADATCTEALLSSFSESIEQTIIDQLDAFVGEAWPAGRNPFDDVYIANTTDALDDMHDHLQFVVTDADFIIFDNEGIELARTTINNLTRNVNLAASALSLSQYNDARTIEPTIPSQNTITLSATIDPNQPTLAPTEVTVDASRSSSLTGDLTFSHDLTLASGSTIEYEGANVTTTINESGDQIWVITATDPSGHTRTQGYVIQLLSGDNTEPVFGGEGSCITPLTALNANTQNICEEAQNGTQLGECDVLNSSSITLVESPAPCAHEQQNGGDLLGVCTILSNEIRLFQYINTERPNNTETFSEQQTRFNEQCVTILGGTWSATP